MYTKRWMAHGLQEVICGFQNKLTAIHFNYVLAKLLCVSFRLTIQLIDATQKKAKK